MDPASLTLAVLPLVAGAVKGYKAGRSRFKTFCHYSSDIERIRKIFGGQRDYFLNEVELLLRLVLENHSTVKAMMRDIDHVEWRTSSLERKLDEKLGRNFETFKNELESYDNDPSLRQKTMKEAMRKLKKRVRITFEKEKFEKQISPTTLCGVCENNTSNPQLSHSVRLFLAADASEEVLMEVAIFCNENRIPQPKVPQTGLMPLEIRSKIVDSLSWENDERNGAVEQGSGTDESLSARIRGRQKGRKVRFVDPDDDEGVLDSESVTAPAVTTTARSVHADLRLSGHFCPELRRHASDPSLCTVETCLGHIGNATYAGEAFRHYLYLNRSLLTLCGKSIMPVEKAFGQPVHNRLTIVGQLRLALQLASAVLKFSSTPWLNDLWTVRDVAFFQQGTDLVSSLRTLHFSTEWAHGDQFQGSLMDVESASPNLIEEAQFKHGVRNVMLYSLGVALLAVGRWENVDPGDVEGVRRLASQPCFLGPKYRELTERVIDCDFGQGKDLRKPKLQEAVYESVILELEGMIAALDLGDA
ncbi:hypothetical protein QBC34DRAFT_441598 [Podospora aff. communis PSN243]|uniref:Prion-inhibition and propagation HeLo domain-containing protein n=1 Tax=Podospora aff. communis PSN243 TaxID=3040156 RepID=A0AAV9GCF5_9PEZI|nr:hypothetical protein QBC34DRAFT_441598 [Podospora aff. communis PSN243]